VEEDEFNGRLSPVGSFNPLTDGDGGESTGSGGGGNFFGTGIAARRHSRGFSGSVGGSRFMGTIDESQEVSDFSETPEQPEYASSVASHRSFHSAHSNTSSKRIVALHLTSISPNRSPLESPDSFSASNVKESSATLTKLAASIQLRDRGSPDDKFATPVAGRSPKEERGSPGLHERFDLIEGEEEVKEDYLMRKQPEERKRPRIQYSFGVVPKSAVSNELSKGFEKNIVASPIDGLGMEEVKGERE